MLTFPRSKFIELTTIIINSSENKIIINEFIGDNSKTIFSQQFENNFGCLFLSTESW